MYNHNGEFFPASDNPFSNRGFLFSDAVFETVRIYNGKVLFLEDHYFRLMSGMRIVRMSIPMDFTMEFIEQQLLETASKNGADKSGRVRMTVYRNDGGLYLPKTNQVSFVVQASALEDNYAVSDSAYEVELFKDFHVSKQLLSSVKTTNRMVNITGSIYADENGYDNCLLINDDKNVIEALNGNVFILHQNKLTTPPVSDGCINGVMRKQILSIAKKSGKWEVSEESISPFDLQKADELFVTNVIRGIQPITKYRKKEFTREASVYLTDELNKIIEAD
ncbi:aminotransferase class IV [Flavobacterium silvaticum]|uniref:branched-chain-amino-acid transaminase n=1 Tax=Flavobacterium silvaticum TaxID=1852020 RepID=A0A972FLR0_9FLAO|nr:aminotransferase class IV [Flavobacterium silvaticum]NMH28053.1 aminotransferase class IV [Flavobacterium silvaticum]